MENKRNINCLVCGIEVLSERLNQKYCSLKCSRIAKNIRKRERRAEKKAPINCLWCNGIFIPKTTIQKFCCEQCQTFNFQYRHGTQNPGIRLRKEKSKCILCGNEFLKKNSNSRFCSKKCSEKKSRIDKRKRKCNHLICLNCKSEFIGVKSTQRFCSQFCRSKYYRDNNKDIILKRKKEYHIINRDKIVAKVKLWQSKNLEKKYHQHRLRSYRKKCGGGRFSYNDWIKILNFQNFLCDDCGIEMIYPFKLKDYCGKCATVDHIIPLSKWEEWSQENNPSYKVNDKENIRALCASCNSSKYNKIEISIPHTKHIIRKITKNA